MRLLLIAVSFISHISCAMDRLGGPERLEAHEMADPRRPATRRAKERKFSFLEEKKPPESIFGSQKARFEDGDVFKAVIRMAESFPKKADNVAYRPGPGKTRLINGKGTYLYFDLQETVHSNPQGYSNLLDRNRSPNDRLDIEGDASDPHYVRLQLQLGKGNDPDNALAAVAVKKGVSYAPTHILYCLLRSYVDKQKGDNPPEVKTDDPKFMALKLAGQLPKKQAPLGKEKRGPKKAISSGPRGKALAVIYPRA